VREPAGDRGDDFGFFRGALFRARVAARCQARQNAVDQLHRLIPRLAAETVTDVVERQQRPEPREHQTHHALRQLAAADAMPQLVRDHAAHALDLGAIALLQMLFLIAQEAVGGAIVDRLAVDAAQLAAVLVERARPSRSWNACGDAVLPAALNCSRISNRSLAARRAGWAVSVKNVGSDSACLITGSCMRPSIGLALSVSRGSR